MKTDLAHSKTIRVWFAVLILLLIGALAGVWISMSLRGSKEPVHKGKKVSNWIAEMYANPNDLTAMEELVAIGSPAAPYLIRQAHWDGGVLGRCYRKAWPKLPGAIQRHLPTPTDYLAHRAAAASTLGRLGPAASNAVPVLIDCLGCQEYQPLRHSAVTALGSMGPVAAKAVPALVRALKDQDFNVRMEAALTLARIGDGYASATPLLKGLLREQRSGVQLRAALALWRLQPTDVAASNSVAQFLLTDPDPSDRLWAVLLIGELGSPAQAFAPALREALHDPDSRVRQNATFSLKKVAPPLSKE